MKLLHTRTEIKFYYQLQSMINETREKTKRTKDDHLRSVIERYQILIDAQLDKYNYLKGMSVYVPISRIPDLTYNYDNSGIIKGEFFFSISGDIKCKIKKDNGIYTIVVLKDLKINFTNQKI